MKPKLQLLGKLLVHALFWPWNLLFLAVMTIGYLPLALIDLVVDALDGLARWDFVVGSFVVVLLPIVVTVQALRTLRKSPVDLAIAFFGVELPVFVFVLTRLFGFQDLSGASFVVLVCLVTGGVASLLRVCFSTWASTKTASLLLHGPLVLFLIAGCYVAFLIDLLLVPAGLNVVQQWAHNLVTYGISLPRIRWEDVVAFTAASLPIAWGCMTLLVLCLLPFVAPLVWLRQVVQSFRAVAASFNVGVSVVVGVVPAAVAVACFFAFLPASFADVKQRIDDADTAAERAAVVADLDDVDDALVDAYLHRHRYLANLDDLEGSGNPWADLWFRVGGDDAGRAFGDFGAALARPFIFQGARVDDRAAEALWRGLHGTHIERVRAHDVQDALSATWSREERYAGFINEGQQKVRLVRQDVVTAVEAGVATVEIHDEWSNLTVNDEEVALFFELPETAALTGLWLSPDGKKENAFVGVVAPRGAAQQIYNEQVRVRRDPALLEQVGPRQYRLRVFPVPARHIDRGRGTFGFWNSPDGWRNAKDQPRQHVWISYEALVDDGGVPFPKLREHRNGFWDSDTVRVVDGHDVDAVAANDGGDWVEGHVDAAASAVVEGAAFGACYRFEKAAVPGLDVLQNDRTAVDVVVDRSLAMAAHRDELDAALARIAKSGLSPRVVLGTSTLRHAPAVVVDALPKDVDFYGAASAKELIVQYLGVVKEHGSALIVLTTQGSFDVADDAPLPMGTSLPRTVIVHLGGAFPAGYDDATLDAVRRSGGSAVADVDEGLARLRGAAWSDGRLITKCTSATQTKTATKLAARQAILDADRGGKADPSTLDPLHALAKQASIVTPYSSMIALVDEAQRQRLKELEAQQDRFDREVENGAKVAPAAAPFDVNGVPEPHEWLLLVLAAVAVVVLSRRSASWRPAS